MQLQDFLKILQKRNSGKKLNSDGRTITINEYSWKNEKKFLESLDKNLTTFITELTKEKTVLKKQSCESSITIGSNIDNDGKYDSKYDDEDDDTILFKFKHVTRSEYYSISIKLFIKRNW